jgi:hypothetical protein
MIEVLVITFSGVIICWIGIFIWSATVGPWTDRWYR